MKHEAHFSGFVRNRHHRHSIALAAILFASTGQVVGASDFNLADPAYQARSAAAINQGKISQKCVPSSSSVTDTAYRPTVPPASRLVDDATKEGQLVVNSSLSDEPSIKALKAAFEMRFPGVVPVFASGGGASAEERILADHAAGNGSIDAVISIRPSWVAKALQEHAILPSDETIPEIFSTWPEGSWRWRSDSGTAAVAFYRALGIGYNSDLVKAEAAPKSYADLAKPEFKGQLLGMDPEAGVLYASIWKYIKDTTGDDTMRGLGENLIKTPLYADIQPAAQALGAGAGMVIMELGGNIAATMKANGAPVETVIPDKATGTQYSYLVSADAQHPNAAKLFAYWLYSDEGQWVASCAALAGTVAYPQNGAKEFVPMKPVSKEEMSEIRQLLGL